jgi:hypothetical protein
MKRLIPIFTLAFLSPFIAEIVLGATPLSRIASFPPLILLYGGGAVLIRELARRTARPWTTILCLGAAYGFLEEGLVMQTLFSPDLFGAAACGLHLAGVNWVWTEALLGYHAVWSIAIPIALTELCFPERRRKPWLGRIGIAAALACYALGAMSIAIVFRRVVTPNFRAPAISLIAAAITAAALVVWALTRKTALAEPVDGKLPAAIPSPWVAGAIALVAAGLWMRLFTLPQILRIGFWPLLPMALAAYLAKSVYRLLRSWSRGWTDLHLLAVIGGAVLASAAYGVDVVKQASPLDRAGQAVCSIVLLSGLAAIVLRRKMQAYRLPAPSVL